MKEEKNSKRQQKVILFPGMVDRLFGEARNLAEKEQYTAANELFEQALLLGEGDEVSLSVFAYALYEAKNYERAKQICEDLLALGPSMYFEVMELYLTVCMQLRQFKQVEKIIQSLVDEEVIPDDKKEKFERLKMLNAQIAENRQTQHEETAELPDEWSALFEAGQFLQLSVQRQLLKIQELTDMNIRPYAAEVKAIIEAPDIHPFIQSLLLILLVEQEINIAVTVTKFGEKRQVNPSQLFLPTEQPQFQEVSRILSGKLAQEPSTLAFVMELMAKHAIVLYPFEWEGIANETLAESYIDFMKILFGEMLETVGEAVVFLQNLEKNSDFQA